MSGCWLAKCYCLGRQHQIVGFVEERKFEMTNCTFVMMLVKVLFVLSIANKLFVVVVDLHQ